jgi:hypothetical protein
MLAGQGAPFAPPFVGVLAPQVLRRCSERQLGRGRNVPFGRHDATLSIRAGRVVARRAGALAILTAVLPRARQICGTGTSERFDDRGKQSGECHRALPTHPQGRSKPAEPPLSASSSLAAPDDPQRNPGAAVRGVPRALRALAVRDGIDEGLPSTSEIPPQRPTPWLRTQSVANRSPPCIFGFAGTF